MFSFPPLIIWKTSLTQGRPYIYPCGANVNIGGIIQYDFMPVYLLSSEYQGGAGNNALGFGAVDTGGGLIDSLYAKKSVDGNTIFWYGLKSAENQYNITDITYTYVAIG